MRLSHIKKLALCGLCMLGFAVQAQNRGTCATFSADNLESLVEGVCEIYEELTSATSSCAAIPISQADFTQLDPLENNSNAFIITQSGNYCLTEDVFGSIIIDNATNVSIDLNDFSITVTVAVIDSNTRQAAIQFNDTITHATIKNGTINGYIFFNGGMYTDIKLRNLYIAGGVSGIFNDGQLQLTIFSTLAGSGDFAYLLLDTVTTAAIPVNDVPDQAIMANNFDLKLINSYLAGRLQATVSNNATIDIENSTITTCVIIANSGYGVIKNTIFEADSGCNINAPNFVILDCITLNNVNGTGFFMDSGTISIIERSTAVNNDLDGFAIAGNNNLIRHCIAESNNGGYGFNITGSAIEVLDCIACNNSAGNYINVTPVRTIGDTNFAAGYNVSCN